MSGVWDELWPFFKMCSTSIILTGILIRLSISRVGAIGEKVDKPGDKKKESAGVFLV